MTEFLRSWILSVSGVIVFGSMCEMILPSGVYKKYIHLAIGLMLVLSFLAPFTGGERIDLPEIPRIEEADANRGEESSEADIIKIYKKKLCDAIKSEIGDIGGEVQIGCDICEDEENFGKIKMVRITTKGAEISDDIIVKIKQSYGLTDGEIEVCDTEREDAHKYYGS